MSFTDTDAVWSARRDGLITASGNTLLVLLVLAQVRNGKTGRCNPGVPTIAALAGISDKTVRVALRRLEAEGLIEVNRTGARSGVSNRYVLLLPGGVGSDDPSGWVAATQGVGSDDLGTDYPPAGPGVGSGYPGGWVMATGGMGSDDPLTRKEPGRNRENPPPSPPPGGCASEGEPTIADLESLALECKPGRRRGTMLTNPEARKLVELADKYGPTAVRDALLEAGGAEMPVAFAAKVLRSRPAERRDEDWDKIGDQRQAERAALRAMTPEQRAERFAPAVAAFARLAGGGRDAG